MPLDGHDQGVDAQLGPEVVGHRPADDLARGHVLDRGQIQEALVGRDVGDVGQPDLVRPVRGEVPRQQARGDREIMAAVRGSGCTAAAPAGREPHLTHQPRDAPARMPQPFPAQLGVDAWRAVDPPADGEDAADLLAQLGFRLGTALDGGDRVEPSVESAAARTDDPAQRGHGMVRPLGRYESELRHAIPLAKKAAALRRISTSSSSRFTSRFSRCVSACSALRTASASAEPAARCSVRHWLSCPVPMPSSVATSNSPLPPSSSRFTACALNSLVKLRRVRLSAILPSWGAWFVSKPSSPRGEVQVGPLLERVEGAVASFTGDGAYDRDDVYAAVAARHPAAAVVVPPRANAVPSETAGTAPTQRDRHLRCIAERGRMGWQRASGYGWRALVECDISRWKRVIGEGLRSQTDGRQATEVAIE